MVIDTLSATVLAVAIMAAVIAGTMAIARFKERIRRQVGA